MVEGWRVEQTEELWRRAEAVAASASRIAAEPGQVIEGTDSRGMVTVGLDLDAQVVQVKLDPQWRHTIPHKALGKYVTEARQAASLEYLRRQVAAQEPGATWTQIPGAGQPAVPVEPAKFTIEQMFAALAAHRDEIPRYQAAVAQAYAERVVADEREGWARATVTGETVVSLDLDPARVSMLSDRNLEQMLARLYHRAAQTHHDHMAQLEQQFPATTQINQMATTTQAAAPTQPNKETRHA